MNPVAQLWEWAATQGLPYFRKLVAVAIEALFFNLRFWFSFGKFVAFFVVGVIAFTAWALHEIQSMMDNLDLEQLATPAASMLHYYTFMNRFIPLSEGFAGAVICFDVWLCFVIIRWVKSLIPTLSN
jgi:hypothetical protein